MKIRSSRLRKFVISGVILLPAGLSAQSLPHEFHFSPDGRQLIRGNQASFGFYEELGTVDTVYLQFDQPDYWDQLIADKMICHSYIADRGFARMPKGIGPFTWQGHTYNANNETPTGVEEGFVYRYRWCGQL